MPGKYFLSLCMAILLSLSAQGQQNPATPTVKYAIQKSYKACIRAFGFDTTRQQQTSSPFSGVVVSADGYILTVAHAVVPERTYKITFPDGTETIAVGLGRIGWPDSANVPDVAIMKIVRSGNWPFAEMGWSENVKEGDPVIGMSYPETMTVLFPTVRYGVVTGMDGYGRFMGTTSAMEPGDSGGPIFDIYGRVIGLNSRCNIVENDNKEVRISFYHQYWTALKKAVDYPGWPEESDKYIAPVRGIVPEVKLPEIKGSACVAISNGTQAAAFGTIIDASLVPFKAKGTYIISKSSEVNEEPLVTIGKDKPVKAQVLARDKARDLVLLFIKKKTLPGLGTDIAAAPETGTFIGSIMADGKAKHAITSCAPFDLTLKYSAGYLGAPAFFRNNAVTLRPPHTNSPAEKAGLKEGDRIMKVNEAPQLKAADYGAELMRYFPGDTVTLFVQRNDSSSTQRVVLGPWPERRSDHPADNFAGGKSSRRDGFSNVFLHDGRVKANECGSPVFDANNKFCGVNIARFSRTITVVLPATEVLAWLKGLQGS